MIRQEQRDSHHYHDLTESDYPWASASDIAVVRLDRHVGALAGWLGYAGKSCDSVVGRWYRVTFYDLEAYANSLEFEGEVTMKTFGGRFDGCDGDLVYADDTNAFRGDTDGPPANEYLPVTGSPAVNNGIVHAIHTHSHYEIPLAHDYDEYFLRLNRGRVLLDDVIAAAKPATFNFAVLDARLAGTANRFGGEAVSDLSYVLLNYSTTAIQTTVHVDVRLSTNPTVSMADTLLIRQAVPVSLEPLESIVVEAPAFSLPDDAATGDYWLGVVVVTNDAIGADDDTSGQDAAPIHVTAAPDLVIDEVTVSDDEPTSGSGITVLAQVRNAGPGLSAATEVRFVSSPNSLISLADPVLASRDVPAMVDEGFARLQTIAQVAHPGPRWIGACVVAVDHETSTTNNCSSGVPIYVEAPDLTVPIFELTSQSDDRLGVSAVVANGGDATAAATTLRFLASKDAALGNDVLLGSAEVPSLGVFEGAEHSALLSFDRLPSGVYRLFACVDGFATEQSQDNNCAFVDFATGAASGVIFLDGFESGDTSAWDKS